MRALLPAALILALMACGGSDAGGLVGAPGGGSGGRARSGTGGAAPGPPAAGSGGSFSTGGQPVGVPSGGAPPASGGTPPGIGGTPPATGGTPVVDASAGAPGGDAAPILTPDGGVPPLGAPTPGVVLCAGTGCTLAGGLGSACCVGPPPFPTGCLPAFPGCFVNGGAATVACDDRADCPAGQICCGAVPQGSGCAATCGSGSVQLCRTTAECASGLSCRESQIGFATCQ